ncbi:hypothetical protein D922_03810 [Enterococcus faecalis 06-MB-DW-09]|nr:hypothetical protein D922_03810 [Enterococcus faecalis 06-MB-DW-09]
MGHARCKSNQTLNKGATLHARRNDAPISRRLTHALEQFVLRWIALYWQKPNFFLKKQVFLSFVFFLL